MTKLSFLVCAAVFFAGCGDDDSKDGSGGAGGASGGAAGAAGGSAGASGGSAGGTGGAAGTTGGSGGGALVWYETKLRGVTLTEPPAAPAWKELGPIVGAKVCLRGDATKCKNTNAEGYADVFGLPASSNVAMLISHADYGNILLQYTTETYTEVYNPALVPLELSKKWLEAAGCASPLAAGKGWLYVGLPPGATAKTTPATKLVYLGDDGMPDPKLTAATSKVDFAAAIACDLAPGSYQVKVDKEIGCHMIEGWPASGDNTLEAVVEADTWTATNWICN